MGNAGTAKRLDRDTTDEMRGWRTFAARLKVGPMDVTVLALITERVACFLRICETIVPRLLTVG